MIRKNTSGDISEEEFKKVLKPFIDDYDNFAYSYILPKVIAYYISNSIIVIPCMKVHFYNIIILLEI